jgi:hypothetical protein
MIHDGSLFRLALRESSESGWRAGFEHVAQSSPIILLVGVTSGEGAAAETLGPTVTPYEHFGIMMLALTIIRACRPPIRGCSQSRISEGNLTQTCATSPLRQKRKSTAAKPHSAERRSATVLYTRSRTVLGRLLLRAHQLKGLDYLFAVRVHVNLASGLIGELVLITCWNRIAEHQRVNDPNRSRLHLSEPPFVHRPGLRAPCIPVPIVTDVASQTHPAGNSRPQGKSFCAQLGAQNTGN